MTTEQAEPKVTAVLEKMTSAILRLAKEHDRLQVVVGKAYLAVGVKPIELGEHVGGTGSDLATLIYTALDSKDSDNRIALDKAIQADRAQMAMIWEERINKAVDAAVSDAMRKRTWDVSRG